MMTDGGRATGRTWRRFWWQCLAAALALAAACYLFVALVDPWDGLPLSLPLPRQPVTSLARYTMPMLARRPYFDSAIIGTSTSRLLRPSVLDAELRSHFVNLSFNTATAYEQEQMLEVFLAAHPRPRYIVWGMDVRWCDPGPEQLAFPQYEFPAWLYRPQRWAGYREIFTLFALREAAAQAQVILGLRPLRRSLDGYENFTITDGPYDLARALAHMESDGVMPAAPDPATPAADWPTVTLPRLERSLASIPSETRVVLFFVPFAQSFQGPRDGPARQYWAECKRRVVALARRHANTAVADFLLDTPFTTDPSHYLDGMHYRSTVADRLAQGIALAARGHESPLGDNQLLHGFPD